jgi:Tol biopolymer transport system component
MLAFPGICLVTIVALAATGSGSAAVAAQGTTDTRIVFTQFEKPTSPTSRIVSVRPDGSDLVKVTDPPKRAQDIDAQISPDGTQVLFERDTHRGDEAQIGLVGADGSGERLLDLGCTDPCAADGAPTWAPAGDRVLFTPVLGPFDGPGGSARSAVLNSALLDGTDLERVSEAGIDGAYEDYHAHYSPDGSYIVFTRVRNKPFAISAFRMNADGSDLRQLTPWKLGGDLSDISPATSGPTKDLVVFETYGPGAPEGKTQNVATVPATCASLSDCKHKIHYLTDYERPPRAAFNPAWAPDGSQIAYTEFKGDEDECCVGDIYTMDRNGRHRTAVVKSPLFEYRPDWGVAP